MKTLDVLHAELQVWIEVHQLAAKPYNDINDIKGYATSAKRKLRKEIAKAKV